MFIVAAFLYWESRGWKIRYLHYQHQFQDASVIRIIGILLSELHTVLLMSVDLTKLDIAFYVKRGQGHDIYYMTFCTCVDNLLLKSAKVCQFCCKLYPNLSNTVKLCRKPRLLLTFYLCRVLAGKKCELQMTDTWIKVKPLSGQKTVTGWQPWWKDLS